MWESPYVGQYDFYQGVAEIVLFAGAVSVKACDFDDKDCETTIDFRAMLRRVKASNYQGYIGIKYEGERLSEDAGIRATKKLLEALRAEIG